MDADTSVETSPTDLAERTGLPPSPGGLSRDEFHQMSRRMGRLNHRYVREAQAASSKQAVQLEYRRNDEGEMALATKVAPVAPLAQRIREMDVRALRLSSRRKTGHAPRESTNARRRGSRRTTGSGSTSSGESDDPPPSKPCPEHGCASHIVKPARGPWPERCAACKRERDRALDRERKRDRIKAERGKRMPPRPRPQGRLNPRGTTKRSRGRRVRVVDVLATSGFTRIEAGPEEWIEPHRLPPVGVVEYIAAYGNVGSTRVPANDLPYADDWELRSPPPVRWRRALRRETEALEGELARRGIGTIEARAA
jgi:hypothetical protein